MMSFRELAIKTIASVRPSLFYYKANASARAGIKVVQSDHAIDITRIADRKIIRISRINYIYLLDMIESFDYFFDSALPVTVQVGHEHYALVDFSTPRLHVVAGFDDFAVLCPALPNRSAASSNILISLASLPAMWCLIWAPIRR